MSQTLTAKEELAGLISEHMPELDDLKSELLCQNYKIAFDSYEGAVKVFRGCLVNYKLALKDPNDITQGYTFVDK